MGTVDVQVLRYPEVAEGAAIMMAGPVAEDTNLR